MRRIRIRYGTKQFQLCIEACKDSLQSSIDDAPAYKMMGKSLLNLDRHEDALEIFQIIENNWPDNESKSNIDRILFSLGRYIELHSRIISRNEQTEIDLDGLRFLARVEARLKHKNLVTTLIKISQKTGDVDDWYEVARVAFNRQQYQDSIAATANALKINSEHEKSRTLRVRSLINEELEELKQAISEKNLIEVADALTDILVVTYGAGAAFGIDLDKCFNEVHRSNMSKLSEEGKPIYNEFGKVMKGPNYSPPDLKKII